MPRRTEGAAHHAFREIQLCLEQQQDDGDHRQIFVSNDIKTSRYTVWNFLPKNVWEQLHKAANLYFFIISMIMAVGNFTDLFRGTINFASTFATLVIMMAVSAIIAAFDDKARHRADRQTNSQPARRIALQAAEAAPELETIEWREVQVGDILVVKSEEDFPADLVPLACSGDEGNCYVSTANLDGETNLKIKVAARSMQEVLCEGASEVDPTPLLDRAVSNLTRVSGLVRTEAPQKSIHNFTGNLTASAKEADSSTKVEASLGPQQILLRGTQLRNTAWCIGIVVYTGHETRMAMNSRKVPSKIANIERTINSVMMVVIGAQATLAVACDIAYNVTLPEFSTLWYLSAETLLLPSWISAFFTFFVLFSNLMPISLYATMEFCNFAQAYFIQNDLGMYDEAQDCAARARSTNLGHELGQVSYIFSDKTGTLTQNIMDLKQVFIDGCVYGRLDGTRGFQGGQALADAAAKSPATAAAIAAFFEILAVSHTVVATTDHNGAVKYEAESPDEGALVEAASTVGWRFVGRKGQTLTLESSRGPHRHSESYAILALNAFTSARKRQSVIAQRASGERVLLVKGADTVMLDRAARVHGALHEQLTAFAEEGLRTLVLGSRTLSEGEFQAFMAAYASAQTALEGRQEQLAAVAESVEKDLEILGATAIEDKLQEDVQGTIEKVRAAGIKLWVLTGDKLETARNIGFSARVLSSEMEILVLDGDHGEGSIVAERAADMSERLRNEVQADKVVALLVTGQAIEELTSAGSEQDFLDLASTCSVVIACRVSPSQKAQMVRLVRKGVQPTPVTLAIGDGANDVPMIQEAQVGIGIAGKEGKQAVNSADFGIAQFRYLQRLLLVHGRWNYRRACKFTLYSFWKNAVLVLMMFYYVFISGNVGTSVFDNWVRASYNMILAAPIICVGCFDRDVVDEDALRHPHLYDTGRRGLDLNTMKLVETLLSAVVHSAVMVVMMAFALPHFTAGNAGDYYTFGTAVFTWLVITMNYRVAFLTTTWNVLSLVGLAISFAMFVVFLGVYCLIPWDVKSFSPWMYWVPVHMLRIPAFWVGCFVAPALATVIDIFKAYLLLEFVPDGRDIVLELADRQRLGESVAGRHGSCASCPRARSPAALGQAWPGPPAPQVPAVPSPTSGSSFAFDHPGGPAREVLNLRTAHPTAGDTSLADTASRRSPTGLTQAHSGRLETGKQDGRSNRPSDWRVSQQKLPSLQFMLTWRVTLAFTTILGAILLLVGGLSSLAPAVPAIVFQYDGEDVVSPVGIQFHGPSTCNLAQRGETTRCALKATVLEALEAPIRLDFVIEPFFQNHAMYLESFSWKELQGGIAAKPPCTFDRTSPSGERYFPCGLQATALFNDTFAVVDDVSAQPIDFARQGVAWPTDVERIQNPKGYPGLPNFDWLFERFPDVVPEEKGSRAEAFVSWMRPAFSPRVHKPYAFSEQSLEVGQNITIQIEASFPLGHNKGHKSLRMTSMGAFGSVAVGFERFLIVSGVICWSASLVVILIQLCCAREAGRTRSRRSAAGFLSGRRKTLMPLPESESSSDESSGSSSEEASSSSDGAGVLRQRP